MILSSDMVFPLQWGPVVVTGIRDTSRGRRMAGQRASIGSGRGDRNQVPSTEFVTVPVVRLQWGPVVVTGIS